MKIRKKEEKQPESFEAGSGGEEGRTVVVGVKMDAESRELLTWALVKVARPGDRVVALHVLPSTVEVSDADGKCSTLLSLVKAFDSVLAVYEGFCNLKQIDLKLKLCRGSSARKVLVREANSFSASKVILGVAKNSHGIGSSSTSMAKYCAKKLPRDCSVLAVSNGKIVFERDTTESNSFSKANNSEALSEIKYPGLKIVNASRPSFDCFSIVSKGSVNCTSDRHEASSIPAPEIGSKDLNCSVCASPPQNGKHSPTKTEKDECLALVPVKKPVSPSSSFRLLMRESPEARPGWPLLRRAVFDAKKKVPSQEKPKVSVVQWAMRLPSRYSAASTINFDHRHTKSDVESRAIVPVDEELYHSSIDVYAEIPQELRDLQEKYSSVCRLFSYEELMKATSNLSPENLIGKGGSSRVFKGCLSDGKELAVKILKPSEDGVREFVSEIEIITALHHKNIISLFGFCFEKNNLILVYNFLSRGSLEENLQGTPLALFQRSTCQKENENALTWDQRYKIAVGVAEALDYLHRGDGAQPVIHRDVKSSNVLLSGDFEPQLADFGLAKWASASASHMTCNDVAGTFGYLAPEYFMYGKVNEKIDVYAFGVVLLELLSGRKPVSSGCPKGEESLVMWAKPILEGGKVKQLVDPCLNDKYDSDQMERMMVAASLCIRRTPRSRPRMDMVMKLLQGDGDVLKRAKLQVGALKDLDGLDDEAEYLNSNIQSHINLALLDIEDDALSVSSTNPSLDIMPPNTSLEEYLKGRWSRSSSFD